MQKELCVVALDPRGSQEFGTEHLEMGEEWGTYLYLVHTNNESLNLIVDHEDLVAQFNTLREEDKSDLAFCQLFESELIRAEIEFTKLPDGAFSIYSTLI